MTASDSWYALSIETSGHIFRLFGCSGMRQDLAVLIGKFSRVGTTAFACREFEIVVDGLYTTIRKAMEKLPYQDRGRSFSDLRAEALFVVPPYIKGGPKLLDALLNHLQSQFPGNLTTPRQVVNESRGHARSALLLARRAGERMLEIHDKSSCCVWRDAGPAECRLEPHPEDCRLAWLCGQGRESFIASLETLRNSDVSEADWLGSNLESLKRLTGIDFLRRIAKNPNALGDAIIFWETPEDWHILTRDRAFTVLHRSHRDDQRVFIVRAPRLAEEMNCMVTPAKHHATPLPGKLINSSATGAMILADQPLGLQTPVSIVSSAFSGPRPGSLVGEEMVGTQWGLRVSFKGSRPKPPSRDSGTIHDVGGQAGIGS